jgi:hypothetical protein
MIARIDSQRSRRLELAPAIEKAYQKAKAEVLENPDYVIQESDFAPVYGTQSVEADIKFADMLEREVFKTESAVEQNAKKIAETLEAIVLMQSEMSEWLGGAQTLKTARYDDYKNKVDMIAEWFSPEDGSRVLALAVDVTFGVTTAEKKLSAIRAEIDSDKLGSIRYFKDSRGDVMGTRNNVPRTVIGVSQPVVAELAQLWLENKQKLLGVHPIQALFADEIHAQLSAMLAYAKKKGKTEAVRAYEQALSAIRPLQEQKAIYRSKALLEDPVAQSITEETQRQFGN